MKILRDVARSYRHTTPGATDDDVRARVLAFVEREGWAVDEAAIDEAIGR